MPHYSDDLSIAFGGAAGQGIQTIVGALVDVLRKNDYHVFACNEFMSRVRGGSNSSMVRVTKEKRSAYLKRIDLLFILQPDALEHLRDRIGATTLIFAEKELLSPEDAKLVIDAPLGALAEKAGSSIFTNTVAVGVVLGVLGLPLERFEHYLEEQFEHKGTDTVSKNIESARLGYDFGLRTAREMEISVDLPEAAGEPASLLINGSNAVGIGSVAAGCDIITSYPMSPGTGLLTFLAKHSDKFGIIVDQSEDEIAAINAALGASYAGARAVVTTSGGGFALMGEGLSLSGIMELPVVIHIGQRPGPATGLPTRTEQGDLNLALYAGHGDFSRAIFAPGTFAQAADVMQRAFALADRFQIPVVVLTDQFFLDSYTTVPEEAMQRMAMERSLVRTTADYERYSLTADGLSPRSVPGYGEGVVKVDSHEHDTTGHLTENFALRTRMVEKRLARLAPLAEEALMPVQFGNAEAPVVLVCWGSNYGVVEEALDIVGSIDLSGMHFSQLYPLNPALRALLDHKRVLVLENNATGQFADLLQRELGITADRRIGKVNGEPFAVEEVVQMLKEEL